MLFEKLVIKNGFKKSTSKFILSNVICMSIIYKFNYNFQNSPIQLQIKVTHFSIYIL